MLGIRSRVGLCADQNQRFVIIRFRRARRPALLWNYRTALRSPQGRSREPWAIQRKRNAIQTIFDIYKEKIDHVLFDAPRAFLKSCDNYKFFVATDSKQFVDLFEKEYSNTIVTERYFAPPGCGTGHEKGEQSTDLQIKMSLFLFTYGQVQIRRYYLVHEIKII